MKTTNIPGFTAERSLYKTAIYHSNGTNPANLLHNLVMPSKFFLGFGGEVLAWMPDSPFGGGGSGGGGGGGSSCPSFDNPVYAKAFCDSKERSCRWGIMQDCDTYRQCCGTDAGTPSVEYYLTPLAITR